MAHSILKEVSFTPQSFEKEFVFDNHKRYGKIVSILENLIDSGVIIALSNQWKNKVDEFLQSFEYDDKDELESLFKELDKRDRLSIHSGDIRINDEDSYISKIESLNSIRAFDFIIGTKEIQHLTIPENISREKYTNTGANVHKQTKNYMQNMLAPILSYAEIVKIYDPYFNLSEDRYFNVLKIVCTTLANQHSMQEDAIVEIHTSVKAMQNKEFSQQQAKEWQQKLKILEYNNHTINIKIWKEKVCKGCTKWHDRWLITNQCGIGIGKGLDIGDKVDSTWALLNWHELPKIEEMFEENNNIYHFTCNITSNNIREVIPRHIREEKERLAKLAKPAKNFKR